MPQIFTHRLNKTIAASMDQGENPPGSLSVRLQGIEERAEVLIDGIEWGVVSAGESDLNEFDHGRLQVICNEIFNPGFDYDSNVTAQTKEVVFEDAIVRKRKFRRREFHRPIKLTGSSSYLIVFTRPEQDGGGAGVNYACSLTVRGHIRSRWRLPVSGARRAELVTVYPDGDDTPPLCYNGGEVEA